MRRVLTVLVIKIDQYVAMNSVRGQPHQNDEVRDQQHHVEAVGRVQALEGRVHELSSHELAKAALLAKCRRKNCQRGQRYQSSNPKPGVTDPTSACKRRASSALRRPAISEVG